jgi:hypothetical protein
MRLTGEAAEEQQHILSKAGEGGQAATKAGDEYQDLIARDLRARGLQEAFSRPGRRMDVGNRHEVTIEGRNGQFSTGKLNQLWLDMRDNGTVLLTVPRLSDQAASQLRRLAGQAQQEFGKKIMVFVRETATDAPLPWE